MDGIHDLGGRQGFGKVRHSPQAEAFHDKLHVPSGVLYPRVRI